MGNEKTKLQVAPQNRQIYLGVGSADDFNERLKQSLIPETAIGEASSLADWKDKGFAVSGEVKKNEFSLKLLVDDLSVPMIHGQMFRPDSGADLVKISFEPNPRLNKVIFASMSLADLLFIVSFAARLFGLGEANTSLVGGCALTLSIFARLTIRYMRAKFPPDPRLVAYLRDIAARTKAEAEDKKLNKGS